MPSDQQLVLNLVVVLVSLVNLLLDQLLIELTGIILSASVGLAQNGLSARVEVALSLHTLLELLVYLVLALAWLEVSAAVGSAGDGVADRGSRLVIAVSSACGVVALRSSLFED